MGKAIDDDSPAEDLHELRKVGKELRYLLEFFASLYPPEVGKPFVKTLKGLQDQLGRFQDHEVQANKLRELAPEVKDPMTLMAMGVLVDRFIKDEALARLEFADRFAAFASPEQRAIVKEHFGMSRVLATYNIKGGVGKTQRGGQPRHARRPRRRADAAVGPRPAGREHVPVPRARPRSRAAARSSCAARRDVDGAAQGHRHRGPRPPAGGLLLPAHGPRARRRQAPRAPARARARAAQDEYEYMFLDCPPSISLVSESVFEAADALLVPIIPATLSSRTLEQLHSVLRRQQARRSSASSRWPTAARSCTAS